MVYITYDMNGFIYIRTPFSDREHHIKLKILEELVMGHGGCLCFSYT